MTFSVRVRTFDTCERCSTGRGGEAAQRDTRRQPTLPGRGGLLNADRAVKLVVTSGNVMTGTRLGHQPRSRYPKGQLTQQMVLRNQPPGVTPLFDVSLESDACNDPLQRYDLWAMLMYFDKANAEIRYEISRPIRTNAKGYITDWAPRITPPPYPVEKFKDFPDGTDPNEGFGDIDVPVDPR
ncbi:hypothetical protein [Virgisporangium aurantiacum]|uniref:Uncharacterized protein n=1 Tax=Virgisporangium aurantiacum TaxID=175570 RepID=A0A8J4DXE1_9ACTN|nr:hypothetical protein [Virgisporangium aurantiacum]GIJ53233.1 hypothetical protein Vau01_007490 [Virgisporangium aurantiacum]